MDFFRAIIDFVIILLLLRLLIRQVEANFNQLFNIIFRITDPLLKPAKSLLKSNLQAVLLSVSILVVIRGFIFIAIKPMPILSGIGISFLYLFQLLFQTLLAQVNLCCHPLEYSRQVTQSIFSPRYLIKAIRII